MAVASRQQRQPLSESVAQRLATIPAAREVVPTDPGLSARWHMHSVPSPFSRWNYHPEYEVHLIRFGTGRYVVGDRIDVFSAGQLVLVGSNLPHHWISDLEPGEIITDRDVVFQFHPDWIRQCQAVLPELSEINALLKRSERGIEFTGQTARRGARESIGETAGADRLQHIFGLLGVLASAPSAEHHTLAKAWLPPLDDQYAADIIDRAFTYIFDNLVGDVRLSAAADLIGMSESAFSKYFKRMSGQTFSDTVRKLRLAQACKLLRDTDLPIASIYHRVGYANLSNFNRQFRTQYGVTPREFRRQSQP
jgi:AraC-like DNA-binding protein/mannose-6-phosphate isomerase-like protein (cupin superfamily)